MNAVLVKRYENFPYNHREIYRYMCAKQGDTQLETLVQKCLLECENAFDLRVCYAEYNISVQENAVNFGCFSMQSQNLVKALNVGKKAVIFVATAGFEVDRLIKKYSKISPVKSLIFSAIGNERVENLCDAFCNELKEKYRKVYNRCSPGYGDLPLEYQTQIFNQLQPTKNIGVTLNDSLLMSPAKSVSAIVGVE